MVGSTASPTGAISLPRADRPVLPALFASRPFAISGASNSGKTTVAKHLHRLLSSSTIIHLDDFAPPQDQIPYSSQYADLQDWDTPATAIDWPLLRSSLAYFKQYGNLPEAHLTHDHLNVLDGVPVSDEVDREARRLIAEVERAANERNEDLHFGILDGFLNFYDPVRQPAVGDDGPRADTTGRPRPASEQEVLAQLDVRIFLRVPYATLKRRRESRNEYVTQCEARLLLGLLLGDPLALTLCKPKRTRQPATSGGILQTTLCVPTARDIAQQLYADFPTAIKDQIVYPAYLLAHAAIFPGPTSASSDFDPISAADRVENAAPSKEWSDPISQGGKGLVTVPVGEGSEGMGKALLAAVRAIATSLGKSAMPH
jgi:nicotinamide/nicotinate riboside kinase